MVQTRHIRMLTAWMVGSMVTTTVYAQKVTYNHDVAKMNQIKVMETGGGVLTPDLYYWTLHNNYKKTAANKNKLTFRTLAGIDAYNQVEFAENIDSALTSRAKIEALNLADRKVDLAWRAEGARLKRQWQGSSRTSTAYCLSVVPLMSNGVGQSITTCITVP
ncbi:uncharacterized protein BN697_00176 [Bacteroides sp. CAG:530]|nr:uncharacterized protein BN697_00176 [Bacteroides sp. CAG:530]